MKWKKVLNTIGNVITNLLFFVLVITALFVISVRASGGEPTLLGYQFKTVLSGSMEPEIQTGSIIAVKPVGEMTRFNEGDIVTFRIKEDILVTHRITEVSKDGKRYITKGDNNGGPDLEPVLAENIVAEYTGLTVPYVGYAAYFSGTKQGVRSEERRVGKECRTGWEQEKEKEGERVKWDSKQA